MSNTCDIYFLLLSFSSSQPCYYSRQLHTASMELPYSVLNTHLIISWFLSFFPLSLPYLAISLKSPLWQNNLLELSHTLISSKYPYFCQNLHFLMAKSLLILFLIQCRLLSYLSTTVTSILDSHALCSSFVDNLQTN